MTTPPANPFRRQEEQDAYRLLHEQGLDAFNDANPVFGTDMVNRWHERGILRAKWTKDSDFVVTTFQKYAYVKAEYPERYVRARVEIGADGIARPVRLG